MCTAGRTSSTPVERHTQESVAACSAAHDISHCTRRMMCKVASGRPESSKPVKQHTQEPHKSQTCLCGATDLRHARFRGSRIPTCKGCRHLCMRSSSCSLERGGSGAKQPKTERSSLSPGSAVQARRRSPAAGEVPAGRMERDAGGKEKGKVWTTAHDSIWACAACVLKPRSSQAALLPPLSSWEPAGGKLATPCRPSAGADSCPP